MNAKVNRPGPGDLLTHAFELFNARGSDYDNGTSMEENMREVAGVASVILGKDLTARDIVLVMACVKLIRSKSAPGKLDNYVDAMNYIAFAACTTGLLPLQNVVKPSPVPPAAVTQLLREVAPPPHPGQPA